jgi:hypothetical protein
MVTTAAAARAGRYVALGLLRATDRATKAVVGSPGWRMHVRTHSWELRADLRTALTAAFLAACGGLLAVIALRGYTIYG